MARVYYTQISIPYVDVEEMERKITNDLIMGYLKQVVISYENGNGEWVADSYDIKDGYNYIDQLKAWGYDVSRLQSTSVVKFRRARKPYKALFNEIKRVSNNLNEDFREYRNFCDNDIIEYMHMKKDEEKALIAEIEEIYYYNV